MKTTVKIIKSIFIYLFWFLIIHFIFSAIYYLCGLNQEYTYRQIVIYSISGNLGEQMLKKNELLILAAIQNFLELICASVLTGYVFAYILNREPKIIMPDKLVIRHRTSEDVNGVLSLGVLVGNRNRSHIHNVCCTITCFYIKKKEPMLTNGEFQSSQEIHRIQNFYRFSFDLKEFPRKVLKDFIDKDPVCYEIDSINVSISGHSNYLGNTFLVSKRYGLADIVFDEHVPNLKSSIKNPVTGNRLFQIVKWNELQRIEEVSEIKRNKTVNEIKAIIKEKKKKSGKYIKSGKI